MTRHVGLPAIVGVAATVELAPDGEVVRSVRVSLIGVSQQAGDRRARRRMVVAGRGPLGGAP